MWRKVAPFHVPCFYSAHCKMLPSAGQHRVQSLLDWSGQVVIKFNSAARKDVS